jgi:hypothetical protein
MMIAVLSSELMNARQIHRGEDASARFEVNKDGANAKKHQSQGEDATKRLRLVLLIRWSNVLAAIHNTESVSPTALIGS